LRRFDCARKSLVDFHSGPSRLLIFRISLPMGKASQKHGCCQNLRGLPTSGSEMPDYASGAGIAVRPVQKRNWGEFSTPNPTRAVINQIEKNAHASHGDFVPFSADAPLRIKPGSMKGPGDHPQGGRRALLCAGAQPRSISSRFSAQAS